MSILQLFMACKEGNLPEVQRLIEKQNVNKEAKDLIGQTPLHLACRNGHLNIVSYLIEQQHVNIEATDNTGHSPLHFACAKGHLNIVQYLIEQQHVNIEATNNTGHSPLHFACAKGHLNIVQYLIDKNANIGATDNNNHTPLDYLNEDNRKIIDDYLKKKQKTEDKPESGSFKEQTKEEDKEEQSQSSKNESKKEEDKENKKEETDKSNESNPFEEETTEETKPPRREVKTIHTTKTSDDDDSDSSSTSKKKTEQKEPIINASDDDDSDSVPPPPPKHYAINVLSNFLDTPQPPKKEIFASTSDSDETSQSHSLDSDASLPPIRKKQPQKSSQTVFEGPEIKDKNLSYFIKKYLPEEKDSSSTTSKSVSGETEHASSESVTEETQEINPSLTSPKSETNHEQQSKQVSEHSSDSVSNQEIKGNPELITIRPPKNQQIPQNPQNSQHPRNQQSVPFFVSSTFTEPKTPIRSKPERTLSRFMGQLTTRRKFPILPKPSGSAGEQQVTELSFLDVITGQNMDSILKKDLHPVSFIPMIFIRSSQYVDLIPTITSTIHDKNSAIKDFLMNPKLQKQQTELPIATGDAAFKPPIQTLTLKRIDKDNYLVLKNQNDSEYFFEVTFLNQRENVECSFETNLRQAEELEGKLTEEIKKQLDAIHQPNNEQQTQEPQTQEQQVQQAQEQKTQKQQLMSEVAKNLPQQKLQKAGEVTIAKDEKEALEMIGQWQAYALNEVKSRSSQLQKHNPGEESKQIVLIAEDLCKNIIDRNLMFYSMIDNFLTNIQQVEDQEIYSQMIRDFCIFLCDYIPKMFQDIEELKKQVAATFEVKLEEFERYAESTGLQEADSNLDGALNDQVLETAAQNSQVSLPFN